MIHQVPFLHSVVLHTCRHVVCSDEPSEGNKRQEKGMITLGEEHSVSSLQCHGIKGDTEDFLPEVDFHRWQQPIL